MINLMRNIGGSVGIAAVTTLLAKRQQVHQNALVRHTFEFNPQFQRVLSDLTHHFQSQAGTAQAIHAEYGQIMATLERQAAVLAYIHAIQIMGIVCFLVLGLLFFAKKNKPSPT
jgi:DHA2 family multidrug resistance protein